MIDIVKSVFSLLTRFSDNIEYVTYNENNVEKIIIYADEINYRIIIGEKKRTILSIQCFINNIASQYNKKVILIVNKKD